MTFITASALLNLFLYTESPLYCTCLRLRALLPRCLAKSVAVL